MASLFRVFSGTIMNWPLRAAVAICTSSAGETSGPRPMRSRTPIPQFGEKFFDTICGAPMSIASKISCSCGSVAKRRAVSMDRTARASLSVCCAALIVCKNPVSVMFLAFVPTSSHFIPLLVYLFLALLPGCGHRRVYANRFSCVFDEIGGVERIFILRINIPKLHRTGQRELRLAPPASSGFQEIPPFVFVHTHVAAEFCLLVIRCCVRPFVLEAA